MEKCYRDIQNRGQIAKINVLELFILIGVPLILFPIFTLFNLNTFVIILIEIALYVIFRMADRISTFDYGMASFVYSRFIWPQKLSAFALDERRYIIEKDEEQAAGSGKKQPLKHGSPGMLRESIDNNGKHRANHPTVEQAARRVKQTRDGKAHGSQA